MLDFISKYQNKSVIDEIPIKQHIAAFGLASNATIIFYLKFSFSHFSSHEK